jgi:hypothetical protein
VEVWEVIMADMLAQGAAWFASQLHASASTAVVFVRGASAVEVKATIGSSAFDAANQSGVIERWESRDFIVRAEDVPFGEVQRGDKVVETVNGISTTYEVASPRGVPLWHYGDAFRKTVRIHAIQSDSGGTYITTEDGDLLIS